MGTLRAILSLGFGGAIVFLVCDYLGENRLDLPMFVMAVAILSFCLIGLLCLDSKD